MVHMLHAFGFHLTLHLVCVRSSVYPPKKAFRAMEVSRSILGGALIKQLISGRIEAGWVI